MFHTTGELPEWTTKLVLLFIYWFTFFLFLMHININLDLVYIQKRSSNSIPTTHELNIHHTVHKYLHQSE